MGRHVPSSALRRQSAFGPWHLWAVTGYYVISGLWTWTWLWGTLIFHHIPLRPNFRIVGSGMLIALCSLLAAYMLYRRRAFAILCIALVPVFQWLGFAQLYPDRVNPAYFQIDLAYFRQLPTILLGDLLLGVGLTLYALMQWKYQRLC